MKCPRGHKIMETFYSYWLHKSGDGWPYRKITFSLQFRHVLSDRVIVLFTVYTIVRALSIPLTCCRGRETLGRVNRDNSIQLGGSPRFSPAVFIYLLIHMLFVMVIGKASPHCLQ